MPTFEVFWVYNLISLKHGIPAGGDDINRVEGKILLTIADGSKRFIKLGSEEPEEIKTGEVIYRDDREVLCRAWNYRECEKTKITEKTTNACLVLEGLEHTSQEEIERARFELKTLISSYCGGHFKEFFLTKRKLDTIF